MRKTARDMAERVKVGLVGKPLAETDAAFCPQPRPMTGLFAQLSETQKNFVATYQGDENHGDLTFAGTPSGR